jgi:hypothetical protein
MAEATNSRIHAMLDRKWPNIALFAYNQFLEHGRGIVVLEHFDADGQSDTTMKYVVYPKAPQTRRLLRCLRATILTLRCSFTTWTSRGDSTLAECRPRRTHADLKHFSCVIAFTPAAFDTRRDSDQYVFR